MANTEVIEQPDQNRFVITVDDQEGELTYREENGVLTLLHTLVPKALSGRGLAGQLVSAAVDRAERDGLTIAPWCPYTRKWLERHPEAADRVTIDWSPPDQR